MPFADNSFGAYIANLSVSYVNNPADQISEAYRVLTPGAAAAFTLWEKDEQTTNILNEAFAQGFDDKD